MDNLIINKTMSSLEIAQITGKEHKNVLADCDKLNESYVKLGLAEISAGVYLHPNTGSQKHREYLLTRIQTFDLMTGYNIELRIKVNRRWEELENEKANGYKIPQSYAEALELAAKQTRELEEQQKINHQQQHLIEQQAPKVEFLNQILDDDTKIDIGQTAKILGLPYGRNTLFQKLREKGIFFQGRNEPKQQYVDSGYFTLKEQWINRNNHEGFVVVKVLVTQKGLEFIAKVVGYQKQNNKMIKLV